MIRPLLLLVLCLAGAPAAAAPAADLWPRWQRHDPASTLSVDHGPWGRLLARHVKPLPDGSTAFAYGAVSAADRKALEAYLADMQKVAVSLLARPAQLAYWINLYNALTVETILEHYPVASIRDIDISPGLFSDGPWGARLAAVEGESLSLDDIEHRILRPIWGDPRIHYAVNCASRGCPDLQPEPFLAERVDHQLSAAAIDYVNHPRGVALEGGEIVVSSIYRWFVEDFGGDERGVLRHLAAFAAPPLAMELAGRDAIDGYAYDWSLNDVPAGR
ncbi:DUF547 domain-containing protein [Marinimicrococcus flavescens]|uniref:DUF547 domain-containing protein n=1 Tax=Marinimicrococcus flavescens TaxID=3031815 RepID=A0AAP3XRQ9_9PROT|nr:DUF547 domain-containing protein [Marinimicrococcus flavescens]